MINRHPSDCRCCSGPPVEAEPVPEPIELPAVPTPIRVHTPGRAPFDCTLHPDGMLTAVINGQRLRNMLTLADMLDMNWAGARIEFNPGPMPETKPEPVQDAIPLEAREMTQ